MGRAFSQRAILLLALVSALSLIALAVLQYKWIAQLGASERALVDASLERGARNFRDEINTELTALVDRTMRGQDRTIEGTVERFLAASQSAQHPRMVKSLYLTKGGDEILRIDPSTGHGLATPVEWPAYIVPLRDRLRLWRSTGGPPPRPYWNETPPAIILPISPEPRPQGPRLDRNPPPGQEPDEEGPPRPPPPAAGWVIFEFDTDYLRGVLLPELIAKHFGSGFETEVVSTADPSRRLLGEEIGHPDVETGFFALSFERPRREGPLREGLRRPPADRPPADRPPADHPPAAPESPQFESPRFELRVKNPSGSFDLRGARLRNLAVTFAVLFMMALTSAVLIVWLRRARELNRMQMDFVAGVSHELRTPLSVIRSAGENLADGVVAGAKVSHYGALIRDEGARLSNMVEQILRFAGVESGRAPYKFVPVAPARLVERAIEEAGSILDKVEMERRIATDLPDVMADEAALSHCLQNLLVNAVKHGGGAWIRIEASSPLGSAFVEFAVTDRGPGIDPSERRNLFNPFFRGRTAVAGQIRGLGVGLSLVKRVVEAHGGRVAAKNVPSGGARFSMTIPVAPADAPAAEGGTHA